MRHFKKLLIGMLFVTQLGTSAQAAVPELQNLNLDQLDGVLENFGAALAYRPLEPASAYADIFGFSFGVIGTVASARKLKDKVPGTTLSVVPGGDIFVGLQGPLGLALEAGFIPSVRVKGLKLDKYGGNLKWTINKVFFQDLPVDVAFRAMYTNSEIGYKQTISGVEDTIDFDSDIFGFNLAASKQFWFVEPYAGIGYIQQDAKISNSGTIQIFNQSVTLANSFSKTQSSVWLYAGFQLRVLFLTLSAQYDRMFGVHTGSAKFAFKF